MFIGQSLWGQLCLREGWGAWSSLGRRMERARCWGGERGNTGTCESLLGLSFPDSVMSHWDETGAGADTSQSHGPVWARTEPPAWRLSAGGGLVQRSTSGGGKAPQLPGPPLCTPRNSWSQRPLQLDPAGLSSSVALSSIRGKASGVAAAVFGMGRGRICENISLVPSEKVRPSPAPVLRAEWGPRGWPPGRGNRDHLSSCSLLAGATGRAVRCGRARSQLEPRPCVPIQPHPRQV